MKIIIIVFLISLQSFAGNDVENGGDAVAFEFTTTARLATKILKTAKLTPELKGVVEKISESLVSTQVNTRPKLFLRDNEVDAINYPLKNLIVVSRSRWQIAKLGGVEARLGLVLHEFLGVSRIDDGDYAKSQKLLEAISKDSFGNLLAQESFLKSVYFLAGYFYNYALHPDTEHKKVCIFAGDVKGRVQVLTQFIKDHPTWFRKQITSYAEELKMAAAQIEQQCSNDKIDYAKLEKSCQWGNNVMAYFVALMFIN